MAGIWQDIKYEYNKGNAIVKLVMLNIALYVMVNLISVPLFLAGKDVLYWNFLKDWLYLPSNPYLLLSRPWTLVTYMYLHKDFWHLLFNMLVLYGFGRITNDLIHNSKIVPIYLLSGFSGAILFMCFFNIFPVFYSAGSVPLVGASAAVMGMLLSAATLNPQGNIRLLLIGNVQLQYVALTLVVIDLISISPKNPGGHIAHLGGAFMGWFYIYQLRKGRDLGGPILAILNFIRRPFSLRTGQPKKKRQLKMVYKSAQVSNTEQHTQTQSQTQKTEKFNDYSKSFSQRYKNMSKQECLDAILDKINARGFENLTEEEKNFLKNSSNK
jgi:membrane associated rhomboid family serine protease